MNDTTTNDVAAASPPYPPDLVAKAEAALRELDALSTHQLAAKYREMTGRDAPIRDHRWRRRRVAMLIQERAFGGLSERARARLHEIQRLMGISLERNGPTARTKIARPSRRGALPAGTILTKTWRGKEITAIVRADGTIEVDGQIFSSLSAAVQAITNQKWNPSYFFNLVQRKRKQ